MGQRVIFIFLICLLFSSGLFAQQYTFYAQTASLNSESKAFKSFYAFQNFRIHEKGLRLKPEFAVIKQSGLANAGLWDTPSDDQAKIEVPLRSGKFTRQYAFRFTVVPALLIGSSLYTMESQGMLNKYKVQDAVRTALPQDFSTHVDDFTQLLPQIYTLGHILVSKPSRREVITLVAKLALANVAMHYSVDIAKESFRMKRPDNIWSHTSFPSGHTAQAFVSATVMYNELGHKSPWYSIVGYTMATATGVMRVMNNRHYISDVLAGAAFGILSAELSYWVVEKVEMRFFKPKIKKSLSLL